MDPLSITTGIITLYSTAWGLKKLVDSYREAPEVIKTLERDCDETLDIILHTKSRLDSYERHPTPEDAFNPIDIRQKLREHIINLHPDIKALKAELRTLLRPPATNYEHLRGLILKAHHVSNLKVLHKKIHGRLPHFDRLLKSLDGYVSSCFVSRFAQRQKS